ncbi:glycoside hydrolase family 3 C-terminal domain-containing protein [Streptomyces sp. NPDC053474]|uniref:glycoside hydrolase family 3 C-terminal domain-containing protein n=1 Tax=Streptomyces sp. NPDC053474 TaxID=3365704 RepID=UPI0037CFABB0
MTERHPPFRDPGLPLGKRVEDLLSRLTLTERISLLHQYAPDIPRLGVAAFRTGQEALHGVAWMGPATVFPQAVGLGATWNDELVRRVGEAVGTEARAMRSRDDRVGLNVWAPTVNLLRHPLWGRNEEGYAEDPKLTAALATAFTRGLRGDHPVYWRTAPVLKHWLAHNNETARDTSSASVRPRVLHEYDLRAFRAPVEAGAVAGVMPAYNLVNGRPNHLSPHLAGHLRHWTEEELLVCSDAGAPSNLVLSQRYFSTYEEALAAALVAGVDSFTDHGTDPSPTTACLRRALDRGLVSEADIDRAARRHLSVRFRLGEFDQDPAPYADPDARGFDTPTHRALAQEAAEQAVVLLKNDGLLPLADGTRIAVVGPLADECKTDWYSGALLRRVTPLDGLRTRFGAEHVTFAEGADRIRLKCAGGWLQAPTSDAGDAPRSAEAALDPALLTGRTDLPPLTVTADAAHATEFALTDWGQGVCTLRAPDGRYLSVADDRFVRASADRPGGWVVQETFTWVSHDDGFLLRHSGTGGYVSVAAEGVKVAATGELFEVEYVERGEWAVARAAAAADVVVVVAGNDPHVGGRETQDRTTLALPPHQRRLWRAARGANPRTALALVSSYPYAVADADDELPALLWTAHGGQAAGTALARVLAGDVSPAGRLPQTWYARDTDLPGLLDYDIIGSRQTYQYFDGTPLYPFGHGLSYSSFAYEALAVEREGDLLKVAFTVTNTGPVAADEVAQLYARSLGVSPVARPRRQLVGHRRVHLAPGASRRVELDVPVAELGLWDVAHDRWTVPPGTYGILAGASSEDIRLTTAVGIDGAPPAARPVRGAGLAAVAYDEQRGTEIVDRTRTHGDAVTAARGGEGELLFRDCDFGAATVLATGTATAVATRTSTDTAPGAESGSGTASVTVEAALGGSVHLTAGHTTATLTFPSGGGAYDYTTRTADLPVTGVRDLRVHLRGPVRLARLTFHETATPPSVPTRRTPTR